MAEHTLHLVHIHMIKVWARITCSSGGTQNFYIQVFSTFTCQSRLGENHMLYTEFIAPWRWLCASCLLFISNPFTVISTCATFSLWVCTKPWPSLEARCAASSKRELPSRLEGIPISVANLVISQTFKMEDLHISYRVWVWILSMSFTSKKWEFTFDPPPICQPPWNEITFVQPPRNTNMLLHIQDI